MKQCNNITELLSRTITIRPVQVYPETYIELPAEIKTKSLDLGIMIMLESQSIKIYFQKNAEEVFVII